MNNRYATIERNPTSEQDVKGSIHNRLTIFNAIVKSGGVREAAKQLQVSPSVVSTGLKQLEDELSVPLFIRNTRTIELTDSGRALFDKTQPLLEELNGCLEEVAGLSQNPSGLLKITLPRFVFECYFKEIYAEFCRSYPDILLEFSINDGTIDIRKSGFDCGIRFGDKVCEDMVAKAISGPIRDALFASPGYLDEHGRPNSLADLSGHKLIQYRFVSSNKLLDFEFNGHRIEDIAPSLLVNDTGLMVDAAKRGLGIGRILEPVVLSEFNSGSLEPVLEPDWLECPPLHIYFAQGAQKAKRVRVFIDFVCERLA